MHVIRLRDPWQLSRGGGDIACWERQFHRPSGLEPSQPVRLELRLKAGATIAAVLNDQPLQLERTDTNLFTASVESLLQPFNRLEVTVSSNSFTSPPHAVDCFEARLLIDD